MPIEIKILGDASLLVGNLRGSVRQADTADAIRQVAGDPNFKIDLDRLIFLHDDLDISETMLSEIFSIKEELIAHYFGGVIPDVSAGPIYKMAFVTNRSSKDAIFRLFSAVMDANTPALVGIKIFHDIADALQWLDRTDLPLDGIADEVASFWTPN